MFIIFLQCFKKRKPSFTVFLSFQVERTTEFNLEIFRELEMLIGCTLSCEAPKFEGESRVAINASNKSQLGSSLERLGLFLKNEYTADEDDVPNGGCEEGEIV